MQVQVDKKQENTSQLSAETRKQTGGEFAFQFADNRPEAGMHRTVQAAADQSAQSRKTAQLQAMADNFPSHVAIQQQKNDTGLPDKLKSGIEHLSGYSLNDVKVHYNSAKPAQLQAHAYAQGTDIHIASGQEKHLAHEAWHVIQQKQGRVQPTVQLKGNVNVNDDAGLENEADVMGAKALQTKADSGIFSPEQELNQVVPVVQAVSSLVVQRVSIDLSAAEVIKPGPPPTLKEGDYFYKVFNTEAQARIMEQNWDNADSQGVLTPAHKVVAVTRGGAKWAFRSKGVAGTFFQFSKPGHTARVTGWIGIQTDKILLGRLRNIFDYVRTGIGDGQGFFENSDGGNIWFIDINPNGTTPDAQDVVAAIDVRLAALG